ncbi:MAG: ABC transporter ATP-binding protein [Planctomycetota bacterium]|nr:ABC transporter ATP-binding protein [Planctomycetota bacterium]
MTTRIRIETLSKHYGPVAAVDQVSITIESGQLFFILGPSGCGKTTLLRMIAGFIEPTGGKIHFDDRDVTRLAPNKRNTGMVFQSYALWPHMSVRQNVAFGLGVRKVPKAEREQRVMEALRSVQMEPYADRKPGELSGGQQQRVALARALVVKPDVLLLDEPLSNLDAKLRLEMRHEIKRICNETGITTVYVTHDQKEALSMADSVAVMRSGRLEQLGPPRDLYDRPASKFVAEFLGETNFVDAKVLGREGAGVSLESAAGRLVSTAVRDEDAAESGAVVCSIRPEAMRVVENGDRASNILRGKRLESVYLGGMAQHLVELSGSVVVKVSELNPPREYHGHDLRLAVDPADVVVLRG